MNGTWVGSEPDWWSAHLRICRRGRQPGGAVPLADPTASAERDISRLRARLVVRSPRNVDEETAGPARFRSPTRRPRPNGTCSRLRARLVVRSPYGDDVTAESRGATPTADRTGHQSAPSPTGGPLAPTLSTRKTAGRRGSARRPGGLGRTGHESAPSPTGGPLAPQCRRGERRGRRGSARRPDGLGRTGHESASEPDWWSARPGDVAGNTANRCVRREGRPSTMCAWSRRARRRLARRPPGTPCGEVRRDAERVRRVR